MAISMYDISIPVLARGLTNLSAILDKAAAHAAAPGIEIVDIRPYQFDERLFAVSARPKPRRRR